MDRFNITKKEWRFVLLFLGIILLVTVLPYLYGNAVTPPDKQYMGVHHINAEDTHTYLAWMQQARESHFLFKQLYTSEVSPRNIFHPLFLVMGVVAGVFNLPNIIVFHIFRILLGFIFLITAYKFIGYFLQDIFQKKICFLILIFSSGVGFLFRNVALSTDLWMTESIIFLTLYESPLFLLSLTLMLVILMFVLKYLRDWKIKDIYWAGLFLLFLSFVHPYDVITVFSIITVYFLFLWLRSKNKKIVYSWIIIVSFLLFGFAYNYLVIFSNEVIRIWSTQNLTQSLNPVTFIFGFGLILLLAILGIVKALKNKLKRFYFLIIWVIITFILVYLPMFPWQRKLIEGVHIPLVILSAVGLFMFLNFVKNKRIKKNLPDITKKIIIYFLCISFLSNLVVILRGDNTTSEDVVLSSYLIGNIIPGLSGNVVYLGHGDQTVNRVGKEEMVDWFFSENTGQSEKYEFLKENRINYVFYSNLEKDIGSVRVDSFDFFKPVFTNNSTTIYEVI